MSLSKLISDWHEGNPVVSRAVLVGAASLLALYLWKQSKHSRNIPSIPTWPLLGSVPYMPNDAGPEYFNEQSDLLGDVFSFSIGSSLVVVLNSSETIHEAFIQRANDFASRPIFWTNRYFNPGNRGIVDSQFGKQLKENRHVSLTILKEFGFGKFQKMEKRIAREVEELIDVFSDKNGKAFSPWQLITLSVSNVICSIIFNQRYAYDDERFLALLKSVDKVFQLSLDTIHIDILPMLRFLPKHGASLRALRTELDLVNKFVKDHLETHVTEKTYLSGENDFVDAFINHFKEGDDIKTVDLEELTFILRDFFLAGAETTATTLKWGLIYMANNQDIQQRCYDELYKVFGNNMPSYEERSQVPYCRATLYELQRISCIIPLAVPHFTTTDTQVAGYHIPQNTTVFANLWNIQRSPKIWKDPTVFDPKRFIDKEGNFQKHECVMPFSLGRRSCLGEILAKQELFLYFTSIIQKFIILPPDGQPLPETGNLGFSNAPPMFTIIAKPRYNV